MLGWVCIAAEHEGTCGNWPVAKLPRQVNGMVQRTPSTFSPVSQAHPSFSEALLSHQVPNTPRALGELTSDHFSLGCLSVFAPNNRLISFRMCSCEGFVAPK